jgi:hypothetical protein
MLTQLVIMSAIVYRLTRFVVIDAIFDGPRAAVHDWLLDRKKPWALKVHEGLECNACMSVWFSAAVVAGVDIYGVSVPLPAITWLACATGALVFAIIIDPED